MPYTQRRGNRPCTIPGLSIYCTTLARTQLVKSSTGSQGWDPLTKEICILDNVFFMFPYTAISWLLSFFFSCGPSKYVTGFNCIPYEKKKEARSVLKVYYGRKPLTPPLKKKPRGEGVYGAVYARKKQWRVAFTENWDCWELPQYTIKEDKKSQEKLKKKIMKTKCKMKVQSPQISLVIYKLNLDMVAISPSIATKGTN